MSVVLDASALLALLLDEAGAERVRAAMPDASISTVNLAEVAGYFARRGASEVETRAVLNPLPLERIAFGEEDAFAAGLMLPATRPAGLSLGDRACLALARRLGRVALTADRGWATIAGAVGVPVEVVR